jgi:glycosyltransferase involved in cell wall biosynthesis
MKVNIICTDVGWIYSKFIDMFKKHSKHEILLNSKDENIAVTYYLPYYEAPKKVAHPSTAWFSHQEARKDLKAKFVSVAKAVDFSISHSKKYADLLKNQHGINNVVQIMPGIDFDKFKLRSQKRSSSDKLIVGYVGRHYTSSNRKNPRLLEKISKLPFVDLRITGGKIKEDNIPKFYESLDITISPATIEGGPMAIQESLTVGTPILCFENVGVANEFGVGVLKVPFGDEVAFIKKLTKFWKTKRYERYRDLELMQKLRAQVEDQTWKNFVEKHDEIWGSSNILQ